VTTGQVRGIADNEAGVFGTSETEDGVLGVGKIPAKSGVAGVNDNGGNGIYGRGRNGIIALTNTLGGKAGVFEGDVEISGKLIVQSANLVDRVIQL
jgi:hypothetical protein